MDLDQQVSRLERAIKAYESKIIIFSSLKFHLESKNVKTFVERVVESTKGDQHRPDIFTIGDDYSFIEEKGSLPETKDTLKFEIEKVLSYGIEHTFEGAKFTPQVILLCPEDIYDKREQSLRAYQRKLAAISYPFPVEDPIILKRKQGTIHDKKLIPTLTGKEKIHQARTFITTITKIQFHRIPSTDKGLEFLKFNTSRSS